MIKSDFNKEMNSLFKKVGVKKLDLHSKEVFSYSHKINYISLYKKRCFVVTLFFALSLALQVFALILTALVPDPRYFMTTFNGHVYEINDPRETMAEAIAVNKAIDGQRIIIRSTSDDDS